jgi:hypothetical protein
MPLVQPQALYVDYCVITKFNCVCYPFSTEPLSTDCRRLYTEGGNYPAFFVLIYRLSTFDLMPVRWRSVQQVAPLSTTVEHYDTLAFFQALVDRPHAGVAKVPLTSVFARQLKVSLAQCRLQSQAQQPPLRLDGRRSARAKRPDIFHASLDRIKRISTDY